MEEIIINLNEFSVDSMRGIFGEKDENIKYLAKRFDVVITWNSDGMSVVGEDDNCEKICEIFRLLNDKLKKEGYVNKTDVRLVADIVARGDGDIYANLTAPIGTTIRGKVVRPKSYGQAQYVRAIRDNLLTFGIGPAGTGKTYLACVMAVGSFKAKEVEKIILTRPAVEAGEKLGFLPGDLGQKVDPYLRPLYDALQEMLGLETFNKLVEKGSIEIAPLAYMRGRTLSNAFIILDEAQNTTREQMKMFLTRMGTGSKIVVTGDVTQIDLPYGKKSGLIEASEILKDIEGISINQLGKGDVVRHELVMKIVEAYEKGEINEKND